MTSEGLSIQRNMLLNPIVSAEPSHNVSFNQRFILGLEWKGYWYLTAEQDPGLSLLSIFWWTSCHLYWDKQTPKYILRQWKRSHIFSYYLEEFLVTLSIESNTISFIRVWTIINIIQINMYYAVLRYIRSVLYLSIYFLEYYDFFWKQILYF